MVDESFSTKSKRWSDIGFQGDCPATDFRGMGMLGAENLRYFVTSYQKLAVSILSSSLHPGHWYPFGVVGINITGSLWRLLLDGSLKTHFYNSIPGAPVLADLHEVYVCLFVKFNEFWMMESRDIMQFNNYLSSFEKSIKKKLQAEDFTFESPPKETH
ncbi:unnamed protein product [Mesocestoides corti]|uniref:ELMO domain-containing protein n=1 Tax=Mesocestoides corti TaxID=53468 RepID=A0A0R3U4R4_MESCO|nr:unnamed protein product [Mesocestoides corti]